MNIAHQIPAVSPNPASALTGRSSCALRRLIDSDALGASGNHLRKIPMSEIERLRAASR
jgi:hypothetical protein